MDLSQKEILLLREMYIYRKRTISSNETDRINTARNLVGKKLLIEKFEKRNSKIDPILVKDIGELSTFSLTKKGKDLVENVLSGYKTSNIPEFIKI